MKKQISKLITLLFLLLGVYLFWRFLAALSWTELGNILLEANWFWVIVSFVLGILAFLFRALRWDLVLNPMGYQAKKIDLFAAVSWGYTYNILIPRSGEGLRAVSLYKYSKIPVTKSAGTIAAERVVDLICLMIVLGSTFLFQFDRIKGIVLENFSIDILYKLGGFLVLALLLAVVFFKYISPKIKHPFWDKILSFLIQIKEGFLALFKLQNLGLYLIYSVGIWLCYYFMTFLFVYAFQETAHLTMGDGLLLLSLGSLGMLAPTNAGIGAYHYMTGLGLVFLGVSQTMQIGFPTVVHFTQTMVPFFCLLIVLIGKKLTNN